MARIHFKEDIEIRGKKATLLFFHKDDEEYYTQKYVQMIQSAPILAEDQTFSRWFITDKLGNDYKIRTSCVNIKDLANPTIKKDNLDKIFFPKANFKQFLIKNHLSEDMELNNKFFDKYLSDLPIAKKSYAISRITWNIQKLLQKLYSVIMIIENVIVGKVNCEILDATDAVDYFKSKDTMYPNMNLYIANVDIRTDFQGKGLCRPLLSYMIKHLRRLGHEMLFIDNASTTKGGVPACICYYKAGIENNYRMRYRTNDKKHYSTFKNMNRGDCISGSMPTAYYYMSDNIVKRAKKKLKSKFQ